MVFQIVIYLAVFWAMQIIAQLFFKWGSVSPSRWLWGFFVGNLFGFSSIWLLMLIYKAINPNIALGISTAGAFLLTQLILALVFKSKLDTVQWVGIIAIAIGMIALVSGKNWLTK
jgi:multidrug transporter EmrE-like cation transporter